MPLTAGTRLGPYVIEAPIGAGGMGEVYRARDTKLNRDVALKVLPRLLAGDDAALARFEREAKVLAALSHPNLLAIHDFGVHDREAYAVMELLEGESLRERLGGAAMHRALPLRKVLDYAAQMARGLAAAHGKQIVHRDLKPENVFVTTDGRVKILDFGLARHQDALAADGATMAGATDSGMVMGTVGYMAPEQVRGEPVDHRGDIFAFGCVLYEMVAGRRAFDRPTPAETMTAILHEDPPAVIAPLEPPAAVHRIVNRCLEKQPDERFQSASDLAFHLEHAHEAPSVSRNAERTHAWGSGRLLVAAATGLALVAAIAAGWWARDRAALPAAQTSSPARFTQLTDFPGIERSPTLSPDGQSIVYSSGGSGNEDIYLLRVGGRNPRNLTADSPDADLQPSFSADGGRIAFRSDRSGGGIFVMGATGESVRRVTDFGYGPSWSPDGSEIAVSSNGFSDPFSRNAPAQLFAVKVATGERRLLDNGDAVQPSWSPNGQRVAFWSNSTSGQRDVWTVPAAGQDAGPRVAVTQDAATDWYPTWSPDGHWLYFLSDRGGVMNVWRVGIEESSGRVLAEPESIIAPALAVNGITLARNGQMAYATLDQRSSIERLTLDPVREQVVDAPSGVLRGSRRITFMQMSPDGESVVFSTVGTWENVFLVRADGSGYRQVTDDQFKNRGPAWSPDGSRIVFYSNRGGRYQMWAVKPDGSGLQQLTNDETAVLTPVWSPNQDRLAMVVASIPRHWQQYDLRAGKTIPMPTLPSVAAEAAHFQPLSWSPDGAVIAGVRLENQRSAGEPGVVFPIWLFSVRDQAYRALSVTGGARWMSDSRRLLVNNDGEFAIVDVQTGRRKPILRLKDRRMGNQFWGFSLSRDDRRLVLVTDELEGDLWTTSR